MTKVCHVTTVHQWKDIRIFQKECRSLVEAGYEVHLIVANAPACEYEGVRIHALLNREVASRKERFTRLPKLAYQSASRIDAELYHFHDPELLPLARKLKRAGKKVIFDSHEDTEADILDKEWIPWRGLRKLVAGLYRQIELKITQKLDGVVTVNEEIARKFEHTSVAIVRNLPIIAKFASADEPVEKQERAFVYAGGLMRIRGIRELIEATTKTKEPVQLHLFGAWEGSSYEEECKAAPGWENTTEWGFLPNEEVYQRMRGYEAGLINFKVIENHLHALPNKSFEYLAAGIPLIMSAIPYWEQQFDSVAQFIDPDDPVSIAAAMDTLLADPELRKQQVEQGQERMKSLTWEKEQEQLLAFYDQLLKN